VFAVAVCTKCAEVRLRSKKESKAGETAKPEDFDSIGEQPAPTEDVPPACYVCGEGLKFSLDAQNRYGPKPQASLVRGSVAGQDPAPISPVGSLNGMQVLFAAHRDEDIKEMREIPGDRFLVITTRRILIVDVGEAIQGGL